FADHVPPTGRCHRGENGRLDHGTIGQQGLYAHTEPAQRRTSGAAFDAGRPRSRTDRSVRPGASVALKSAAAWATQAPIIGRRSAVIRAESPDTDMAPTTSPAAFLTGLATQVMPLPLSWLSVA